MKPRITIDDNEAHYLKVLCDEILGRQNFVANIIWQKAYGPRSNAHLVSDSHDHLLVYAKNKERTKFSLLSRSDEQSAKYKNPDNDLRGPWKSENSSISLLSGQRGKQYAKTGVSENIFEIQAPDGTVHLPPQNRCWAFGPKKYQELLKDNRIWFGKDGKNRPSVKRFLSEVSSGVLPQTVWLHQEVGHNQDASREIRALFPESPFSTPKPEKLLNRILHLATSQGDLVLDSFAGSGTTGAVAQKMGRRWIMVELGDHCETHIVPRLKKVINGEDQGGISKAVNWKGGGGYRYFRLAPSLLKKDSWGNWIINKEYNAEMLSEAMCKHMGFTYAPSQKHFWMHGYSTETDFIYVTTGSLSQDQLKVISDEVGKDRSLVICCKAFMADADQFPNLTLKKIPQAILHKCEWDHDDYSFSLNVLPDEDEEQDEVELGEDESEEAPDSEKQSTELSEE